MTEDEREAVFVSAVANMEPLECCRCGRGFNVSPDSGAERERRGDRWVIKGHVCPGCMGDAK